MITSTRMRMFRIGGGLVASALALGAGQPVAAGGRLLVDDDRQQCPRADFASIGEAIAVAGPGDRIRVCPGLYAETVRIDTPGLVLEGSTDGGSVAACLAKGGAADPRTDSVIAGRVELLADDVVVGGFTVQNPVAGSDQPGIYTSPAFSGYRIHDNVVRNNTFGIHLNSAAGHPTHVTRNCIADNNLGFGAVYESGFGIYSDEGLHRARITRNTFPGTHAERAIVIGRPSASNDPGPPSSDVVISHNLMVDEGGLVVFNTTDAEVSHNRVVRLTDEWTIGGLSRNVTMAHNHFEDGPSAAILVFDIRGTGPITNALVAHNRIVRQGFGVFVLDSSGHSIVHNRIADPLGDGIVLSGESHANHVARNHVSGAGRDGIRVGGVPSDNVLEGNHLRGNVEHDAHDNNRAANTWLDNRCETDLPAGAIC